MFFWGYGVFLRKFFLGILEFSASLRGGGAKRPKQSLGILDLVLRNSRIYLEFPTMSSSGLTRGSL